LKAFVSYSTHDKQWGGEVKRFLDWNGVSSFLAHDDLQVSEEWKERIYRELLDSDIFICLLSTHYRDSDWCSQEIGIAVAREDIAIIPISLDGTHSYGFIGHLQSAIIKDAHELGDLIHGGLLRRNTRLGLELSILLTRKAGSFRGAEAVVRRIVPYFDQMDNALAEEFAIAAAANYQVWDAGDCRIDYLPKFLESNRDRISPEVFEKLQYQIENEERYPEELL
jgi:hypothetical protein